MLDIFISLKMKRLGSRNHSGKCIYCLLRILFY